MNMGSSLLRSAAIVLVSVSAIPLVWAERLPLFSLLAATFTNNDILLGAGPSGIASASTSVPIPVDGSTGQALINTKFNNNIDATAFSGRWFTVLNIFNNMNGTSAKGNHVAVTGETYISATPSVAGNYVGVWGFTNVAVNLGGVNGVPAGSAFGINPQANCMSAATYMVSCVGDETDVVNTSSSTAFRIGLNIADLSVSGFQGVSGDYALLIGAKNSAPAWGNGIYISNYNGIFGIATSGSVLASTSGSVTNGIDLSNMTFSGSPYLAPLMTPVSSSGSCKQGAFEFDASFIYICTATNTWKRAALSTF